MDELQFQLSTVDTIIIQYHWDCHIILGGDFNVDMSRNWSNTMILDDYCSQANLFPVTRHKNSVVDYMHHFNIKHFSSLDHFIISEQLYQASVDKQFVLHDIDNTSDHEPLCMHLAMTVAQVDFCHRVVYPKPSWDKASDSHIAAYKNLLRIELSNVVLPYSALLCKDMCCSNIEHICSLNDYLINQIANVCLSSANDTIPMSRCPGAFELLRTA